MGKKLAALLIVLLLLVMKGTAFAQGSTPSNPAARVALPAALGGAGRGIAVRGAE